MGKLSEGVGIGVKTESVSRLSVAQVGLALQPLTVKGHVGPGCGGVGTISHVPNP